MAARMISIQEEKLERTMSPAAGCQGLELGLDDVAAARLGYKSNQWIYQMNVYFFFFSIQCSTHPLFFSETFSTLMMEKPRIKSNRRPNAACMPDCIGLAMAPSVEAKNAHSGKATRRRMVLAMAME